MTPLRHTGDTPRTARIHGPATVVPFRSGLAS
ncbi:MAG: hypothetical protein QOD55_2852 [Solirubrobacteraceae bacterium]|jgi:hypothetical protein|nr:hypothetical protein [Solirubrobacteraceae bacterium]MEA2290855.1 hypothetical protein [Solirubrobacteraceae bacterium]